MNAGDLRHRVTFEAAVDTQDDATGAEVRSWGDALTVWAAVEPMRGTEGAVDGGVLAERDTVIRVRYSPGMAAYGEKDRATWNGVAYNIVSVRHVETRKREIQFLCKSGANDG